MFAIYGAIVKGTKPKRADFVSFDITRPTQ